MPTVGMWEIKKSFVRKTFDSGAEIGPHLNVKDEIQKKLQY